MERGYSLKKLADDMGVSYPTVYGISDGLRHPSMDMLYRMAEVLDVHPGMLLNPPESMLDRYLD